MDGWGEQWERFHGLMLSNSIDKTKLADFFRARGIVAELVWDPKTSYTVGLRLATREGAVGTLAEGATEFTAGPTLQQLADDLAQTFQAEVRLGQARADAWTDKDSGKLDVLEEGETTGEPLPVRLVEIGTTPSSAVPVLAAVEGVPLAELEIGEGKRALLAEVPASRPESTFGDLPVVTLRMEGGALKSALIKDDDPDSAARYDWGLQRVLVVGEAGTNKPAPEFVQRLVGARAVIEEIHDAVPGIDVEGAYQAATHRGQRSVREFVAALGLPQDVAEFLLGTLQLRDVMGARISEAGSIRSAIGRSVEKTLEGEGKPVPLWQSYTRMALNHPYLMQAYSSVEAISGTALVALSRMKGDLRPFVRRTAATVGALFLIDSMVQTALSRYAMTLHYRSEAEKQRRRYRH